MFDAQFFLALSFLLFLSLLLKVIGPKISAALGNKSKEIADELKAAKKMRTKAAKLLKEAEAYNKESSSYAKKLLKDAQAEADKFLSDAQKAIADELAKKTAAAKTRIKFAEEKTLQDIQNAIVTAALEKIEAEAEAGLSKEQNDFILAQVTKEFTKTA